jgi:hypothetical protein
VKWVALLLLAGCSHTIALDKPRVITVTVPVVEAVDPALVADCQPVPLAGTTVGAILERLDVVEDCLARLRDQLAGLRAHRPPRAISP